MGLIPTGSSFDASFYLARNADVKTAAAAQTTLSASDFAYQHWLSFGAKEQRNPNAFFSTSYYFLNNGDVLKAFLANNIAANPLTHYDTYGWLESRNPSVSFNTSYYTSTNTVALTQGISALAYYQNTGLALGQAPTSGYASFDYNNYLTTYTDVAKAVLGTTTVPANSALTAAQKGQTLTHWFEYGQFETRTAQDTAGNAFQGSSVVSGTVFTINSNPSSATTYTGGAGIDTYNVTSVSGGFGKVTIDGVAGADVLNYKDNVNNQGLTTSTFAAVVKNIQNVVITSSTSASVAAVTGGAAANTPYDLSAFDSTLNSITLTGDAGASNNINLNNVQSSAAITLKSVATTANAEVVTITYASAPSAGIANITLNGSGTNSAATSNKLTVDIESANTTDVTAISLAGVKNGSGTSNAVVLDSANQTKIATVTLTGSVGLNITDTSGHLGKYITKVDGSAHTSGFTFTDTVTNVAKTVITGAGNDTVNFATGGTVVDTVQFGGIGTQTAGTIAAASNMGADTITHFTSTTVFSGQTAPAADDILSFSQAIFSLATPSGFSVSTTASTSGFSTATSSTNGAVHNLFINPTITGLSNALPSSVTGAGVELDAAAKNTSGIVVADTTSAVSGTSVETANVYFVSNIHAYSASTAQLIGVVTLDGANSLGEQLSSKNFAVVA